MGILVNLYTTVDLSHTVGRFCMRFWLSLTKTFSTEPFWPRGTRCHPHFALFRENLLARVRCLLLSLSGLCRPCTVPPVGRTGTPHLGGSKCLPRFRPSPCDLQSNRFLGGICIEGCFGPALRLKLLQSRPLCLRVGQTPHADHPPLRLHP